VQLKDEQLGDLKTMAPMPENREKVEFENGRVRVTRVNLGEHEKHPSRARNDRVLIWLTDAHHVRVESGKKEEIRRRTGEVAWRDASRHEVENVSGSGQQLIIVELKK
jgi:hypothetical protein